MPTPVPGSSGPVFAYLSGSHRGREVLRHVLARRAWRPGVIVVVSDASSQLAPPGGSEAGDEFDGIPFLTVASAHSPEAWWAMAAYGVQGVLAVGVPDRFEESFLKAFPLGVYGLRGGLVSAMSGPAAVNWAIIRGESETGTTLLRYQEAGIGCRLVEQAPCPVQERDTASTLCTRLSARSADMWLRYWPAILRNEVTSSPVAAMSENPGRRPEDGAIRWATHSAASLDRWIRALGRPYPGGYFWFAGRRIWVHCVEAVGPATGVVDGPTLASVSDRGMTLDLPDGRLTISDLCLDGGTEVPRHVLAALADHIGERMDTLCRGKRVLVLAAHPDDEVLGVGGTLIRHFKRGDEVRTLIVCSAESIRYHHGDHDQPGDTQRASHYIGAQSAYGLGFPDQRLDRGSNLELIQALEREIQAFRPEVIYTHWWGDVNVDHSLIAEALDVAARPYSAPFVESIYAFETPSSTGWTASARAGAFAPDVFVDISEELDRKLDAMRCYQSELRPHPHPRSLCSLEERAAYWGSVANMRAAEAFMLLRGRQ